HAVRPAAGGVLRVHGRVGRVARRAPLRLTRALAQDREEGGDRPDRLLLRRARRGAVPWLDRRPEGPLRRRVLAAAVHPPQAREQLVEDQYRAGGGPDRVRPDEAGRAPRGGTGPGRRPLGAGLRVAIAG